MSSALSKRSQDFVRYVVEHTLTGRADMLKERTIGIEVFGRSTSYEPSDDATVRVKAGDVRKRLGLYYAEEGAQNPVRIELPPGTYVPEFHWSDTAPRPQEAAPPDLMPAVPIPANRDRYALVYIIVAAIVIVAASPRHSGCGPARSATVLDQFWAPVLKGTRAGFSLRGFCSGMA